MSSLPDEASCPRFSVVIPARNEEKYIGACLDGIDRAEAALPEGDSAERIVVLDRCTDDTERIARERGARIVRCDAKNLSRIRNAGVAAARGDIVCTVDADSVMSENMFTVVDETMRSGRFVGGGVWIKPERVSLGIAVSGLLLLPVLLRHRVFAGLFFFRKADFDAVGGFDESRFSAEDIDFAVRLKRHGRTTGRRYANLRKAWIVTSCRKFDAFGDWFPVRETLRHPLRVLGLLRGDDPDGANRWWYDVKR